MEYSIFTVEQRLAIYERALLIWKAAWENAEPCIDSSEPFYLLCDFLADIAKLGSGDAVRRELPEFVVQRPFDASLAWWPISLEGTLMRLTVLQNCIDSCKQQLRECEH